jgi:hypothetical protein
MNPKEPEKKSAPKPSPFPPKKSFGPPKKKKTGKDFQFTKPTPDEMPPMGGMA